MIFVLLFISLIAGICTLKLILQFNFSKQVKTLFANSPHYSGKRYNVRQLTGLPDPVQRYFLHVLRDGQPYINTARLTHDGYFKIGQDKAWVKIKGEQYFTTCRPGFIWKGKTSQFTAIDQYILGKGRLQVFLMALMRIINGQGESYDQGELMRWISESVWFPTNLLPAEHLNWLPIDATKAQVIFRAGPTKASFIVTFDKKDEIIQMETRRYMGKGDLQPWVAKMTNYKEINNIIVPSRAEAIWRLAGGDFSYARFHINTLQYGVAEKFDTNIVD